MAEEFVLFVATRERKKNVSANFEIGGTVDDLKAILGSKRSSYKKEKIDSDGTSSDKGIFDKSTIKSMLDNFISNISAYKSLFSVTSMIQVVLYESQLKSKIIEKAIKDYHFIEEYKNHSLFGIANAQIHEFDSSINSLLDLSSGLSVLPKSNLLSIVATFDSFIADIAFRTIRSRPGLYGDEKKISLKDIVSMSSLEDVADHVAWQDVQDCMRGSHASQIEFIEKISDTKIISHYDRWPNYTEIFERRNLVAHQDLIINRTYIENCKKFGIDISNLKIGDYLKIDAKYLIDCVDILLEFGTLLTYSIWKKKIDNGVNDSYEYMNEASYDLIKRKNYLVASRILDFCLNKQSAVGQDAVRKMMTVNLANCYKNLKDADNMKKTLSSVDWSGSSAQFLISIAAIENDVDKVVKLMPKVASDEEIGKEGFRSWPVFDEVKKDPKFREAFAKTFDEPLSIGKEELENAAKMSSTPVN